MQIQEPNIFINAGTRVSRQFKHKTPDPIDSRGNADAHTIKLQQYIVDLLQANTALKQDLIKRIKNEDELLKTNRQLALMIEHTKLLAEEAEEANRAKSEFLSNISQKFRAPMNVIVGFTEFLRQSNLTKEQLSFLETISTNSSNMLKLFDDLFDFSEIDSGKLSVKTIECEVEDILSSIDHTALQLAEGTAVQYQRSQQKNLIRKITTDPLRLKQCLIHLIDNAFKFTREGVVSLNVFHDPPDSDSWICFEVLDTGIGILYQKQITLFDPFREADENTPSSCAETGFGLAITRQIVDLLGGHITLTSEEDTGTAVLIKLPVNGP